MAEEKYGSKLSELLSKHDEAVKKYLEAKKDYVAKEDKYNKEVHRQRKDALQQLKKDLNATQTEEMNYLAALEKLIAQKDKYSQEDITSFEEAKKSILNTQKYSNAKLSEAIKEEQEIAKQGKVVLGKSSEDWTALSKTIGEAKATAGAALNNMLDSTSKFIDGEISHLKGKLGTVTKELENFNKNLKQKTDSVLSRGKADAKAQISEAIDADDGDDKYDRKQEKYEELEELERLHNLEAELAKKKETLTDSEEIRLQDLRAEHVAYADSLKVKDKIEEDSVKAKSALEANKKKLEYDIQKKESQKKKVEFSKQVIQATINIAEGVTKALAMGPIIGPIMAGVVGAAGVVQLSLMASQRNKFEATTAKAEDGGLLRGRSHRDGGMPILGSNIEVEGGEYVVNRDSTAKNLGLIRYINSQRRELGAEDISSYFAKPFGVPAFSSPFSHMMEQGGQVPMLPTQVDISNSDLLHSIQNMKFEPRVAVTDIHTVQGQMAQVDEWVGM